MDTRRVCVFGSACVVIRFGRLCINRVSHPFYGMLSIGNILSMFPSRVRPRIWSKFRPYMVLTRGLHHFLPPHAMVSLKPSTSIGDGVQYRECANT